MRIIWLFLLFPIIVRGEWEELFHEDEDSTLAHHINVITGQFNFSQQDARVEGAHTLTLERSYTSAGVHERKREKDLMRDLYLLSKRWYVLGGWSFFNHTYLITNFPKMDKAYHADHTGSVITYDCHSISRCNYDGKPSKTYFQCSGKISARTNPGNNLLQIRKSGLATLFLPNGTVCHFKDYSNNAWKFFLLEKEVFPDGHEVLYYYDKNQSLVRLEAVNAKHDKIYAFLEIKKHHIYGHNYHGLEAITSDGRDFFYHFTSLSQKEHLESVESKHCPFEKHAYEGGRTGAGSRINKCYLENDLQLAINYDKKDRAVEISGPLGLIASYHYEDRLTDVRDSEGLLTRYRHDGEKLLAIEHYNAQDKLETIQKYFWGDKNLTCKALLDEKNKPLFAKTFSYDDRGNITEEVLWGNLSGQGSPLTIDDKGHVTGEHYGRRYTYTQDCNAILTETEDSGLTTRYSYLPGSDLVVEKTVGFGDTVIKREVNTYDDDHLLICQTQDNTVLTYQRDPTSGMIQEIRQTAQDKLLKRVILTYSEQKKVIEEAVFDANDHYRYTLYTDYDDQGHVISKTTPLGLKNTYRYDNFGRLAEAKEVGRPTLQYTYDAMGRQIASLEKETGKSTKTSYDKKGRIVSETDFKGLETKHRYNHFGKCMETQLGDSHLQFAYDKLGNLIQSIGPLGECKTSCFTALRKPIIETSSDGATTEYLYYLDGSLKQVKHPDGSEERFTYDPLKRMIERQVIENNHLLADEFWTYQGNDLIAHKDINGLTTHYFYDEAGRKIAEEAEGRKITYSYDALGFVERTDNGVKAMIEKRDEEGRVIKQWEECPHIENEMSFTYDEENRKIAASRLTAQGYVEDHFVYDVENRMILHTDPLRNRTKWQFDPFHKILIEANGNRTIETLDLQGHVIEIVKQDLAHTCVARENYTYDISGNCIKRLCTVYEGAKPIRETFVQWEYDARGRIIEENEDNHRLTTYAYDGKGRLIQKGEIFYTYDALDRLITRRGPDINETYTYGLGPHPITISNDKETIYRTYNLFGDILSEQGEYILKWEYDPFGRRTRFILPDHSSIVYTYEGAHLKTIAHGNYVHQYHAFDVNGHVIQEMPFNQEGLIETHHDVLERPISQKTPWHAHKQTYGPTGLTLTIENTLFGNKTYAYDALNQVIKENEEAYTFDSLGNPTHYAIGSCNQLKHLSYDRRGNTTCYNQIHCCYDALDNLIQHGSTHYEYDPLGRMKGYLYDQDIEIGRLDSSGNIIELKVLGLGLKGDIGAAVIIEINGWAYVPLHDFSGNIIAICRHWVNESYAYDAFGRERVSGSYNPWRFSSKRTENGLVFFQKRAYCPQLQRWLTPDPIGTFDSLNRYLFVHNNSLRRLDLFGLLSQNNTIDIPWFCSQPFPQNTTKLIIHGSINGIGVDFFIASDTIYKLSFTPEELQIGKANLFDHLHEMVTQGPGIKMISPVNGILTDLESYNAMCNNIADQMPGVTFMGLHNRTHLHSTSLSNTLIPIKNLIECGRDIGRVSMEQRHIETKATSFFRQFLSALGEKLYHINPDGHWLITAHSEGGVIVKRSIEGMNNQQREAVQKNLLIYAIGPAEPISNDYGFWVKNVYSEDDFITKRFSQPFLHDPAYDIQFLSAKSPWHERTLFFADHAFMGTTYQENLKDTLNMLKSRFGIANAFNFSNTR